MRSRMRSRSASAKAAAMVRKSLLKPFPAMSPPRSSRWSFTPRVLSCSTTLRASRAERKQRSSLAAITMSPALSLASIAPPPGGATVERHGAGDAFLDHDPVKHQAVHVGVALDHAALHIEALALVRLPRR